MAESSGTDEASTEASERSSREAWWQAWEFIDWFGLFITVAAALAIIGLVIGTAINSPEPGFVPRPR